MSVREPLYYVRGKTFADFSLFFGSRGKARARKFYNAVNFLRVAFSPMFLWNFSFEVFVRVCGASKEISAYSLMCFASGNPFPTIILSVREY